MANELVPTPGGQPSNGDGDGDSEKQHPARNGKHQVFDPLVAAGYVDTDEETAGMEWNLPPEDEPVAGLRGGPPGPPRRRARRTRRAARAREHGLPGYAVLREADAADNRQQGWGDWGDARTWAIIAAMFFGFLLFVAFVYFSPTGRHNQNDGPLSVPAFRGY